jgi:ATP-dependent exoDNAse (exonuclease V) beta subunit
VHALLSDLPLDGAGMVTQLARAHGRVLGASVAEVVAAASLAEEVLAQPLMQRAALAARTNQCFREVVVTYTLPDGALIEGTVDLAFEEADGYTVVDFKTDREITRTIDEYRRQVQIYTAAVSAATGRPARGVLFRI